MRSSIPSGTLSAIWSTFATCVPAPRFMKVQSHSFPSVGLD
jgi:hypothetical protein